MIEIVDLDPDNQTQVEAAAALLNIGFREISPAAWTEMQEALDEVREALEPGKICRIALDEKGTVVGWIGGIPGYNGNAWELHPLVVHPEYWRRGIGRALVLDLEKQVKARGGITIHLGTDDENDMTSLSGKDLYPDVCQHIAAIQNLKNHPYSFYQKVGFVIVGLLPDANGFGKPDILMAKRVR